MMREFDGKIAVITGAASGIGLELARQAVALGMRVALADIQADGLAAAARELGSRDTDIMTFRLDVAHAAEVETFGAAVQARFGAPHLVFNNAGVASGGFIWETSPQTWEWVLGVNLMGVAHGVRVFVPAMLAAAAMDPNYQGHIINTASMAGLVNPPTLGVYNVTKHAVVSLTETLHHDLALVTDRVRAHVLCPYYVPTAIVDSERNRPADLPENNRPTTSARAAWEMTSKAVAGGKISAARVTELTFQAIRDNLFYIYSHPQTLAGVRTRMEDILQARNPSDPYADRPDVGARLRALVTGR
jgi:NAD(P)-dependent dehydrogenase (short-subunit alcohol dehydrogenase family)